MRQKVVNLLRVYDDKVVEWARRYAKAVPGKGQNQDNCAGSHAAGGLQGSLGLVLEVTGMGRIK